MFFVKRTDRPEKEKFVLKIYESNMLKAFLAEKAVLTKLRGADFCKFGFPKADSIIEGEDSNEILFEALGKDLKRVMGKCA